MKVGGSGSKYVYVGFDYLNFHLYVEYGCVDYGYNCFELLMEVDVSGK
jgi:hypothetical protein